MPNVRRIRKPEEAQRYVAESVAALIHNEFDNGSGWLSVCLDDEDTGNLADIKTEELVHTAARQLEKQLEAYGKQKARGMQPSQEEWATAAWELYQHIHSRGEGPTFHLFLKIMMPLINRVEGWPSKASREKL